jgi:hypothetical protein
MKKIIFSVLVFCFLSVGNVFSQVDDQISLVIKTVYENDGFNGWGLDLGSLKDRKIDVYSDSVFSKGFKGKPGKNLNLVIVDKLTGCGRTVVFSYGPKPHGIVLPDFNSEVEFKTINKKIEIQGWAGGQEEIDLFNKIMASKHRTYNLNSTITSRVTVMPFGNSRDSSVVEILEWLVVNYNIYNFSNRMDDEVKVYKHIGKKGNACFLFYNPRTFNVNLNGRGAAGTFFYVEKPENKILRRVLNKIKLNINADDNSFEIEKFTDSGPDEVILGEEMLKGLIKETLADKFYNFRVKKTFSVKAIVTKEF